MCIRDSIKIESVKNEVIKAAKDPIANQIETKFTVANSISKSTKNNIIQ